MRLFEVPVNGFLSHSFRGRTTLPLSYHDKGFKQPSVYLKCVGEIRKARKSTAMSLL